MYVCVCTYVCVYVCAWWAAQVTVENVVATLWSIR